MKLLEGPIRRVGYGPLNKILRQIEDYGGIICGGYARHLVTIDPKKNKEYSDIDIYPGRKDYLNMILDYAHRMMDYEGTIDYSGIKATTFKFKQRPIVPSEKPIFVQVIEKFGYPVDIIRDFDISVCQVFAYLRDGKCYFTPGFWDDLIEGQFRYLLPIGPKDTERAFYRISKYLNKGFRLDTKDFLDIYRNLPDVFDKDFFMSYLKDAVENKYEVMDWQKIQTIDYIANT